MEAFPPSRVVIRKIQMKNTQKIQAKKSLGQNFLKSKLALSAMVKAGDISASDTVLEIGPGQGALTEKLLETGAKVIAVEKDDRLIEFLQEKFLKFILTTCSQWKMISWITRPLQNFSLTQSRNSKTPGRHSHRRYTS